MKNFILLISYLFLALLATYAQQTNRQFDLAKYKGKIGQYPITMFLAFYPDGHCSGYYYYDSVGQLLQLKKEKNTNILTGCSLGWYPTKSERTEKTESLEFKDSLSSDIKQFTGIWMENDKNLPFSINKEPSQIEWKYFNGIRKGNCSDDYISTSEKEISIMYPSIQSSKNLNESILSTFIDDKALIQYLNLTESYYTVIRENFEEFCTGYWDEFHTGEVVFYTDSILTYRLQGFTYANNGDRGDYLLSIKISSGKQLYYKDIFRENAIDTVLYLLKNKYQKTILKETDEYNTIEWISKSSNIYIVPSGICFNDRLYKLAPFVHLFLSFKELEPYLNESFKELIK